MRRSLIFLATSLVALAQAQQPTHLRQTLEKLITADAVKPLIVELASDKYEGRQGGYPGERRAAEYIAKQFAAAGLQPMGDARGRKRSFLQEFTFMPSLPLKPWEKRKSQNVIGFLEGSDPVLRNEITVLGAHYDGQGMLGQADAGPRTVPAGSKDRIWNSANDNLASVSAITEIAKALTQARVSLKRSVMFIAFGAEENGVPGSVYYVNHPAFELPRHVAMINLECVGRMADKPLMLNGAMTGNFWSQTLKEANEEMGTEVQPNIPVPIPDSDHYPFASARIASATVMGSNDPDRHRPSDTADKIDFDRVAQTGRFVCSMAVKIANQEAQPKFTQSPMPDMGMIASLATPAECDAIGLPPDQGCFRVTGLLPRRASELAGFQVGDAMLQVNDFKATRELKLADVEKMMEDVLRGRMGKELKIIVQRNGKRLELTLQVTSK